MTKFIDVNTYVFLKETQLRNMSTQRINEIRKMVIKQVGYLSHQMRVGDGKETVAFQKFNKYNELLKKVMSNRENVESSKVRRTQKVHTKAKKQVYTKQPTVYTDDTEDDLVVA